ncbi:PAS domain-containing protein [Hymenobacter glacieicola]|uniref:histidine kinase n=1 Tax=Hymenobacter glacieicola TaxID=1562124 RepID=A0ABQ1WLF5_9BACT|nr:PAS domain-containing protein [Hymenobacter glacieicola]GGG33697.1 hypothetical protein GCM10011378_07680 [Hymenobacter glacieicola]
MLAASPLPFSDLFPLDSLLSAVLDFSPTGLVLCTPEYNSVGTLLGLALAYLNPAAQRLLGLPAQPSATFAQLFPGSPTDGSQAALHEAFLANEPHSVQLYYPLGGHSNRLHLVSRRVGSGLLLSLTAGAAGPEAATRAWELERSGADPAALRTRQEERQAFLLQLSDQLRPLTDPADMQYQAACALGQYLGASRVGYAESQGDTAPIVVTRNYTQLGVSSLEGRHLDYGPELLHALQEGRTLVRPDIAHDPELTETEKAAHAALQLGATVNVPLLKDGQLVAVLFIHYPQAHAWREEELSLLEEAAARTWSAVLQARSEATMRARERQLTFLLQVSDALRPLPDSQAVQTTAARLLGEHLEVDRAYYIDIDEAAQQFVVAWYYHRSGAPSHARRYPLGDWPMPWLLDGQTWVCHDVDTDPVLPDEDRAAYRGNAIRAAVVVPLLKQGKLVATFVTNQNAPRAWTTQEVALVEEVAERIWGAVERASVQEALRKSEQQLRAFVTASADTLYHMDADWQRMRSLQDKEFLIPTHHPSTTWLTQYIPAADQPAVQAAVQAAIAGRHFFELEHRVLRADGSVGWTLSRAVPVLNEHGALVEWFGAASDITASKQAEEALRQSEEQFRTVVNLVPDLLWRSNAEGKTSWYNQRWYEYTGQTPAEAAAYGWVDVIHPDDRASSAQRYREAVLSGQPLQQEHRIRSAAGEYRWFQVQALSFHDEQSQVGDCFGAATDIHQLKLAEEAMVADKAWLEHEVAERTQELRENQELLQSVFDTSLISMSVLRAVRNTNGNLLDFRIAIANRELAKESGRTDLVGKLYSEEFPGIKLTGLYNLMLGVLATGEPAGLEYYYPYEGFGKWYACQFVKLDDGLVATNLDITQRKLAEEKNQEQAHFIARVNETLPDLMTVTDLPSGIIVYVNKDLHEASGFERGTLLNLPVQQQAALLRMHPDDAALLPDYFARAATLADHQVAECSYRAQFNTGTWRWFAVRGSVFQRDPTTGAATQILSVAQDVTARKEAELQQAKSYQLLEQSEEVASLGSWDYDRRTGEFLWSAGMYRLFGLPPGSPVRPETYLAFALAEDRPVAERLVQGLTTGRTGFGETLRLVVAGHVKTLRVKASVVLNEAGEPQRVLGVDLDISEVQRLEADNLHLRLSQQQALFHAVLDAQEAERRRLAESLHNGVGQTLYATKLQLNQLLAGPAPQALSQADRLLADAIRQTRTLSHELVPAVLHEFGLAAGLREVCRSLSGPHLLFTCTVELDEQHPLALPLQVAVYRMAQELAQNVVKHAHATEAHLALETVPGHVLLRAEDNGVGFAPGASLSTGLGLRTIRDRVALLGGTVDLGSSPEFGTYVRLRLPLPAPSAA